MADARENRCSWVMIRWPSTVRGIEARAEVKAATE